jgi:hypothetical protein
LRTGVTIPHMPRVFALAAGILAASCGGRTTSPTASTPVASLPSGAYVLMLSITGGVGISACLSSGAQPGSALPTNVQVEHTGNTVTIQPEDSTATFRMDLQMSGTVVSGTASGEYRSGATTVTVTGLKSDIADAIGTVAESGAAGNLTGWVAIPGVSCNGGNWSLTTR